MPAGAYSGPEVGFGEIASISSKPVWAWSPHSWDSNPLTAPFQRDRTLRALSARARNSAMFWSLAAWYAHPSAVAFQR